MAIQVKAKMLGLYKGVRKREGAEFSVADESELARWMERLDGKPNPKDVKRQRAPSSAAVEDKASKGKSADGPLI